jgi:arabinofuranosyltransferase
VVSWTFVDSAATKVLAPFLLNPVVLLKRAVSVTSMESRLQRSFVLIAVIAVFLVAIVRTAWMADDAYITLRTVDNFVHGYGLRWNISERVQSYTHPLWMFLIATVYAVTRESFFTTIALNIIISLGAVIWLSMLVARTTGHAIAVVAILTCSRAFTDFSTGGFENALSHLLLGVFAWMFLVRQEGLRRLSLVAALLACNRVDLVLILAPALATSMWRHQRTVGWLSCLREIAIGFSPLLAWEAFSLLYYGFPFPNTAYVKIATGISRTLTAKQGAVYFFQSIRWDPILLAGILGGLAVAWFDRSASQRLLAIGAALYIIYVIFIGGDFMKGRFLTAPFYALMCVAARSAISGTPAGAVALAAALVCLQIAPALQSQMPEPISEDRRRTGVIDERLLYEGGTSLLSVNRTGVMPNFRWAEEGRRLKAEGQSSIVTGHVGLVGYFAGPGLYIIDHYALTDAFLAHVPPVRNPRWRMGHFHRAIPAGYRQSALTGHCQMEDPSLCEFFDRMHLIITGPIFSWERLVTIVRMNFGAYDHLVRIEQFRLPKLVRVPLEAVSLPVPEGAGTESELDGVQVVTDSGLDVDLGEMARARAISISIDSDDDYTIEFFHGEASMGHVLVRANYVGGMRSRRVSVPKSAQASGYDRIRIQLERGDSKARAGYLLLAD